MMQGLAVAAAVLGTAQRSGQILHAAEVPERSYTNCFDGDTAVTTTIVMR
ncbi:hypothetical protein BN439_3192 [Erwinia amylovora Ea644]|uniref:Uncharacterized protein n=3 Tax=Erwinia amylovora TaxID=552 RepID=A0A830ZY02_ERWAM|nr:hypothetical protein EaACW_2982 [Erwinia amylovora ACW56400]QJQ53354.1 hypothetical protein EHX00_0647 [Erwinia amylovora]CBA22741.1 hypothetical protein predicted by Glimmer/Critica [Erwinia amylovora CFBP1430]CBX81841.1 hypothetical protein predicted by Glimmer/Critica [Erwinia amylovora ATCC BAA-2158]CCO79824.1 hypothetical protein BN432_3045 [Erwinia amylovora Ea356]CCO83628.1 hypothetical protein BN433_3071 [Erwinia amylovora Ea266]CCO87386.1 hypothetical protein BN434_3016 [Erwinia a